MAHGAQVLGHASVRQRLLIDQLLRWDPVAAARTLPTLSSATDTQGGAPSAAAALTGALAGMEILEQCGDQASMLRYLRRLIRCTRSGHEKQELILSLAEILMRRLEHGDAHRLLSSYVQEEPYRSDDRFHGWLGLCSFALARAAEGTTGSEQLKAGRRRDRTYNSSPRECWLNAQRHLFRAIELNPSEDQYVRCLSQVLVFLGNEKMAKLVLGNFCLQNPYNAEGFRLQCELLMYQEANSTSQWSDDLLEAAVQLARCDPTSKLAWSILDTDGRHSVPPEILEMIRQQRWTG